jgi:hypothetical protein
MCVLYVLLLVSMGWKGMPVSTLPKPLLDPSLTIALVFREVWSEHAGNRVATNIS